ncbi:MAG TPA: tyrosine-type recombinase/integrase [Geminicoccus sp.]|uniref:tyrosine-type recombinase/integrase n=1 Tax=Geminicoccus sp. TaxID=2024832 RepID=UPI002E31049C|nr:tyrosine-type recombinase/integrase [Geminicoccus sp.]HEX2525289.1 tyrosine-type recombinase/integrase [Geminicoccus sp.]
MASIRKRTWKTDGRERAAWVVDYVDAAGRRRLKTFQTKKAADAWSVQAQHQVASGTHTPESGSLTVEAAGKLWIKRCELDGLEASTLRQYQGHLDHHIFPALGSVKLSRLNAPQVGRFIETMLATKSRALTRKVLVSLRQLLSSAQRQGLVAQNAAAAVRVAGQERHEDKVEIISPAEARMLLAKASDRVRPLLATAIFTGLRASELRGLRWIDLDLDKARLAVTQRADENGHIGSPKSASSRRTIPLPPAVVGWLREWQSICPKGDLDLVFPNGAGKPESLANLKNRVWGPLQIECGLTVSRRNKAGQPVARPRHGLHVTRHFYASWLINQGFSPKRVQTLMGHSTIKLTLDVYGHLWPDEDDDAARLAAAETALISAERDKDATNGGKLLIYNDKPAD